MNKLLKIVQSPYPVANSRWKGIVVTSVIIYLLIAVLQPFGVGAMEIPYKPLVLVGFGVVTALALCVTSYLLPALFPVYYAERHWTVGRQVLNLCLLLVLIAFGNTLYMAAVSDEQLNWSLLAYFLGCVVLLAPIPVVIVVMWNRNTLLRKNLLEATEMNALLLRKENTEEEKVVQDTATLTFTGGTKESLVIEATQFLYAEAEGNYVKINYTDQDKCRQVMLRSTLTQVEEMVAAAENIVRCHRTYLINIYKVSKVEGNAQGYRLHLDGCKEEVPVSRAYAKSIKQLLSSHT